MDHTEPQPFIYRAKYEEVINAQTIVLTIDLGFRIHNTIHADLANIDAHNQHGEDDEEIRRKAEHETRFVRSWLNGNQLDADTEWPLLIRTYLPRHDCEQGDYAVNIYSAASESCLNEDLAEMFPKIRA